MRLKKLMAAAMCIFLLAGALCGCDKKIYITTGLKADEIFKLSGEPCSLAEILLVLMTEKSRYEEDLGVDIWSYNSADGDKNLEDEIKSKVKTQLAELKTIELLADKEKIALSDSDSEKLKSAAKEYYESLSEETIELLGVTEEDVLSLYTSFYKADKVYEKLTSDVNPEISDEEARVIQVRYMLFPTCNIDESGQKIPLEEQDKLLVQQEAAEALKELDSGNDFSRVCAKYTGEAINAYISRDNIQEAIENVVFELESGQISPIIETSDGYYIFMSVSVYFESQTVDNKVKMQEEYKREAYSQVYKPFQAEQTFEFNNKVWDNIHLQDYIEVNTLSLYDVYNKWTAPTGE